MDYIYLHDGIVTREAINKTYYLPKSDINLILKFEESTQTLTVKRQGEPKVLIRVPIREIVHTLNSTPPPSNIDKILTFDGREGPLTARLIIRTIQGKTVPGRNFPPFESMKLMLLIKLER